MCSIHEHSTLECGNPYTGKTTSLYWDGPQIVITRASLPWTSPPYRPSSWKTNVAISSFNENVWISIKIPVKFVQKGPINNIQALVHIMAWCRPGAKALSEPMMVGLPMHTCVTRPQWVESWLSADYVESHDLTNDDIVHRPTQVLLGHSELTHRGMPDYLTSTNIFKTLRKSPISWNHPVRN